MKNQLIIFCLLITALQVASQTWIQKSNFPSLGRENAVAFSIGDNGYIGTGKTDTAHHKDFWEYNTTTDEWAQKTDIMGSARSNSVGISAGGNGFIGTGSTTSGFMNDFFEYNPGTGSWSQKAVFAGPVRQDAVAFRIGDKGYFGTGKGASAFYKDFWEYNPANDTWTQKADLPGRERKSAIGFGIGDKGYIGLGFSNLGDYRNEFYEYTQSNNVWIRLPEDFPGLGREYAVSFGVDALGRGYVMCGYKALSIYLTDCWEFIQATQEWMQLPTFGGVGRSGAVGFAVNGTAYMGLGKDASGNYLTDFWALELPNDVAEINNDFGQMYPSPVHDNLTVELNVEQAVFSLYDLSGKKVNETNMVRGENMLHLASLPEAVTFIRFKASPIKKFLPGSY